MKVAKRILKRLGAHAWSVIEPRPRWERLPVLCYHSICAQAPEDLCSVSSERFTRHMEAIGARWKFVPLSMVADELAAGVRPKPGTVAVTFDDGYVDNHTVAFPILERLRIPATILVVSGFVSGEVDLIDRRRFPALDVARLIELVASGLVEIGAHSHTHPILSRLAPEAVEQEIDTSRHYLEDILQRPVSHFAYPNGQAADIPLCAPSHLRAAGFACGLSTIWRSWNQPADRFMMRRIMVHPDDTPQDVIEKVEGRLDFIHGVHVFKGRLSAMCHV